MLSEMGRRHRVSSLTRFGTANLWPSVGPRLPLASMPSGPACEVEDRHMGDAGGANDGWIVAVGTGEECLHPSAEHDVAQWRVDLAERKLHDPGRQEFALDRGSPFVYLTPVSMLR